MCASRKGQDFFLCMISQEQPFIPQLIQEIPNFKSWVQKYLENGFEVLIKHAYMHLFQLFMDSARWLVMQYKAFPTYSIWNPKDGLIQFDCGSLMIKVATSFLVEF
jgi:hypothetical protein